MFRNRSRRILEGNARKLLKISGELKNTRLTTKVPARQSRNQSRKAEVYHRGHEEHG